MESNIAGDFASVYNHYRKLVFQTAFIYTHNQADIEEIAQEVFLRYYIYSKHKTVENPGSWLAVTTRNYTVNYLKHMEHGRLLNEDESMELLMEEGPDTADVFFENLWKKNCAAYASRILEAIRCRNKRWYDALVCAYCMNMPRREIADYMGTTVNGVEGLLARAKKWIIKNYREEYDQIVRRY